MKIWLKKMIILTREETNQMIDRTWKYLSSHANVSKIAYAYWEKDGRPNGEDLVTNKYIKLKDLHWMLALAKVHEDYMVAANLIMDGMVE